MAVHTIQLPSEYGYVVLDAVFIVIINLWLMMNVRRARKTYDVKYPALYSDKSEMFNCIQRAHQNTLETLPMITMMLFVGGLQHPLAAAVGGFFWAFGRVIFAKGYYTGEPKKRAPGAALGMLGMVCLLFCTISFALHLLGWL